MWSGRLPERTHDKLRSLVAGRAHDSQSDAIAAAVDLLAKPAPRPLTPPA
jgi:Arc/MetJ-type ribon-helix-helix transcriptional regulator